MKHSFALLIVLLLVATSCQKEQDSNPIITEPDEVEILPIQGFNPPVHQNIIETQLAIFQLLTTIMKEAIKTPSLYYFNGGDGAEVRTGCPSTSLSGTTFPKTLTMTFDDGTGSCTNAGIPYEGSITVVFNTALGTVSTSDPEIQVTDMTGLIINGYAFDLGGTIDMELPTAGGLSFFYEIAGGTLASVLGDVSTSVAAGTTGSFTLGNDVNDDDNPLNPATYIDNAFDVGLDDAIVTCENTTTGEVTTFCTDTEDSIELQPQTCSCPIDGILRIKDNNGVCFPAIDNTNSTSYDFGDGTCDSDVEELIKVIELISYEGVFTAIDGGANGLTSTDVGAGIQETSFGEFATPVGHSIQLTGSGSFSSDFSWTSPSVASPGLLNAGQTFTPNTSSLLPWINEFHYDDASGGTGEFVEIAGPAGLDLSCYELLFYDGTGGFFVSTGTTYATQTLSGVIPDEGNGFGAIAFDAPVGGIQNVGPAGFALVKSAKTHTLAFCE